MAGFGLKPPPKGWLRPCVREVSDAANPGKQSAATYPMMLLVISPRVPYLCFEN